MSVEDIIGDSKVVEKLEGLLDGWKVSNGIIHDNRGNGYSVSKVERFDDYAKVILKVKRFDDCAKVVLDDEEGFILKNVPYVWKGNPMDGIIKSFNGKSAIYYNGNVSPIYDKIYNLKIENGNIYAEVKDSEESKIILLDEELNELAKSRGYNWIGSWKIEDGKVYGEFVKNGKYKFVVFDEILNELNESDEYDWINDWEIEDGKIHSIVGNNGEEKTIILDENLKEI